MTILRHLKLFPTGVVRPTLALGFAVMAVAIMACSFDFGIARVGISADGSLFVEANTPQFERFESDDGGLTWRPATTADSSRRDLIAWGDFAVNTPRGRYSIEGSEIIRAHGGVAETAYSAAYLRDAANRILQSRATSVVLTTTPQGIAFDRDGGSVVIAMGSQGVVVGGSDGRWRRIAVGHYTPTDFSVSARMGLLGSLPAFWAMLLLFVGSVPAVAIVAAQCRLREGIAVIAGPVTAFLLKRWPAHAAKRRILALSTVSAPLVWVALTFPRLGPWADGLGAALFSFLTLVAVILAFMAARPYCVRSEQWTSVISALAAMFVGATLPTLLWLMYVLSETQAGWAAAVVASATTIALFLDLKRRQHDEFAVSSRLVDRAT